MTSLILASLFFLGLHLLIAGTRVRDWLVARMGEQTYLGLFSLASVAGLVWMAWSFTLTKNHDLLWVRPDWLPHAGGVIILIAFLFVIPGLTTPSPTLVRAGELLKKDDDIAKGIIRVTRHPFLWGVAIWATFHMCVNGDLPSVIFFGSFILLALAGMVSIDAKRKRAYGADWDAFAAKTSLIPFGAIIRGRNKLALGEIGIVRLVAAAVVFGAVLYGHGWLFGIVPFQLPGM